MITVVRGPDRFRVTTLSWEAARVYAQQVGWRPSGAMGAADGMVQSPYGPGRPPDRDAHVAPRLALVRWAHGGPGEADRISTDGRPPAKVRNGFADDFGAHASGWPCLAGERSGGPTI